MPEISRFYGIIIAMFWDEHNPPHFHARYGSHKAALEIDSLRLLDGKLPPRALGLVVEWASGVGFPASRRADVKLGKGQKSEFFGKDRSITVR